MKRISLPVVSVLLLALSAPAQIGRGEIGLLMVKGSGRAGSVCGRQFSCRFRQTPLRAGEQVTLEVRGVLNRSYAIALGLDRKPLCLRIAGFHNALMFPPAVVPWSGVLATRDRILACPGGLATVKFRVPNGVPKGAVVLLQALAFSFLAPNRVPTFTPAIRATVQ